MMTGKYGVNNGVPSVPGTLDTVHTSIFKQLKNQTNGAYQTCLVGKWHLGNVNDYDHPNDHGVDDFMGVMSSGVTDYYKWPKVENQIQDTCYEYVTSYFTDYAANWINNQNQPWMMWLAHVAPHSPFHEPPAGTFTTGKTGGQNFVNYQSMIENMDYEIGRLLDSIPQYVLDNTLIIFVGDNGSPFNLVQYYSNGKGSLNNGGIHVPSICSGYGVNRQSETDSTMISITDIFATIAHLSNDTIDQTGGLYNSLIFKYLLSGNQEFTRTHNYMELGQKDGFPLDAYTLRDEQYKMIQYIGGNQEFYDLYDDPLESKDLLLNTLTDNQQQILDNLVTEVNTIRTDWSCQDGIFNGSESSIDCGGNCGDCVTSVSSVLTSDFLIEPNPATDVLNIELPKGLTKAFLTIYNTQGQVVNDLELTQNRSAIRIDSLSSGIYIIALYSESLSKIDQIKFVKK